MNYFFTIFTFFQFFVSFGQTYRIEYEFTSKNTISNQTFKNASEVLVSGNSKWYYLHFKEGSEVTENSSQMVFNPSFEYTLYSPDQKKFFIKDKVQGKYYTFVDQPIFKWVFSKETRLDKNKVQLHKATTNFRGRKYTVWYQKSKVHASPWKFKGIPGIVYEVIEDKGDFGWKLLSIEKTANKLANPFEKEQDFVPYSQYENLRYKLSPQLEKALSQNPNRTIFEQERVDLEINFEDEKQH